MDHIDSAFISVKQAGQSGREYVSNVGANVAQHYGENKEAYQKGAAIAALSVAALAGLSYCRSVGFTKNYGKKKTKIIEKALKQLPVSELKEIIRRAESLPSLSRRQQRALTMTRNYLRCVENSLDVSDKFNAKRRQVILRFKVFLDGDDEEGPIDYDDSAAEAARKELEEFGIDMDMDDDAIDNWFTEEETPKVESQSVVKPQVQQAVVASKPTTSVKQPTRLSVGNFTYTVPESHVEYLELRDNLAIYKGCISSSLQELGISAQAYQIPVNRREAFVKTMMKKLPDRFWYK